MKNWKIILASVFLCCIIISCGDKKAEDDTEQVNEQQTTQEQLETEKQKSIEDSLQAEAEKHQKEDEQKKQVSKTDKKQTVEAGKSASTATSKIIEDEQYSKPRKFMKAENVSFASRGLLSSNVDIKYTIVNTSSSVSYKNVAFRIEYLDANNEVLATKEHKYNDEIFAPNQTKDIATIIDKVKGTETIKIRCIDATAVR